VSSLGLIRSISYHSISHPRFDTFDLTPIDLTPLDLTPLDLTPVILPPRPHSSPLFSLIAHLLSHTSYLTPLISHLQSHTFNLTPSISQPFPLLPTRVYFLTVDAIGAEGVLRRMIIDKARLMGACPTLNNTILSASHTHRHVSDPPLSLS